MCLLVTKRSQREFFVVEIKNWNDFFFHFIKLFVFSAADFNQAYKRMLYLKQYSVFRKSQAIRIEKSKIQLVSKKNKLKDLVAINEDEELSDDEFLRVLDPNEQS